MILIDRTETDPFYNIAAEEYVLKAFDEDVFMLWVNRPSVIIGKHQVATAEADIIYTWKNNIPVIRRISGGGTVYHDTGNLNYTLVVNGKKGTLVDYKKYSSTVIRALKSLSLSAALEGKSSLVVDGLKFSGNAEHVYKNRVLHHGTLLFDSDLQTLRKCIRPQHPGYVDRSIRSNDSKISNLKVLLPDETGMQDFRNAILRQIKNDYPGILEYQFSAEDDKNIRELIQQKYGKMDWNFGYSPSYKVERKFHAGSNQFELILKTEKGLITEMIISVDGKEVQNDISQMLINKLHHPNVIKDVLLSTKFALLKKQISLDKFISGLF